MRHTAVALFVILLAVFEMRIAKCFISSVLCSRMPGLTQSQRIICTESADAVVSIASGQLLGAIECQKQFHGHRWNCSHVWKKDMFGQIVAIGSKEAAYTYGITSAGAVYSILSACSQGNISTCGCNKKQKTFVSSDSDTWKWGGCSVDIFYGMSFARKFLDAREIENDNRSLMNLHNNRVGRKTVKALLRTECKCHGVSGSCAMKTCWKSLPSFQAIGNAMMKKYRKAKLVHTIPSQGASTLYLSLKRRGPNLQDAVIKRSQNPKRTELVYLQPSPNYCERNISIGILGTVGRSCNRTSKNVDRCDLLCCGRGYDTHQNVRSWQCNCKFKWCCTVACDICTERKEEYTCK
ncbi:protein Wnt-2 isoform X1 [Anopheles aquasalis]|uniref:protein Wnt-2 isoform X1 n=1 Tax=Anopheles aquasalis TaxID=42839 RepID=UPI00215A46C0|nr:protein Wnt-2 isoform X1 [Anopheles aquasalis]XP_050088879.1 protein Wnt-2 isoform X1 [Anopheles aquasalis]XP_050088880.1 protein Wnt-2 isoform X1 [Anopheles aquasalis]XP_050088881.1 protein Wnt-2 isoform X1 [Anopheles aquasalis]